MTPDQARYGARQNRRFAQTIREQEPGYGTHRYRGDPPQAVAHDQLAERYDLCAAKITLDGKPASIGNVHGRFAKVVALDGKARGEWAWPTARLIVEERGGEFRL